MATKSTSKPQTRIQKKNRAAIQAAALQVFSTYGFRGSTLDQIAEVAKLTKPNILYYYKGKEEIHRALLSDLLDMWLAPLAGMDADGEPIEEILSYVRRKLEMSRDFPRESRLFANEVLQGAPHIQDFIHDDLKTLVDDKVAVITRWIEAGRIAPIDPYHLMFSIWAMTQHYADFEAQVEKVLPQGTDPFSGAETYLDQLFRRLLTL